MQRFNLRMTEEMHSFFKDYSEKTNISMGGLMLMALQQFIDQKEALKMVGFLDGLEKLKEIAETVSKVESKEGEPRS